MTIEDLILSGLLEEFNKLLENNPEAARAHWLVSSAPAPAQAPATTPAPAITPARR